MRHAISFVVSAIPNIIIVPWQSAVNKVVKLALVVSGTAEFVAAKFEITAIRRLIY